MNERNLNYFYVAAVFISAFLTASFPGEFNPATSFLGFVGIFLFVVYFCSLVLKKMDKILSLLKKISGESEIKN